MGNEEIAKACSDAIDMLLDDTGPLAALPRHIMDAIRGDLDSAVRTLTAEMEEAEEEAEEKAEAPVEVPKPTPAPEPAQTNYYLGEYRSGIARAKKILLAAGFAWSKTTGVYSPFEGGTQRTSHGVKVSRVGCSDSISVHAYCGRYAPPGETRELEKRAILALRVGGLPFDDRGWLHCGARAYEAAKKAEKAALKAVRP